MTHPKNSIRNDAIEIWQAGVDAANGTKLVEGFVETRDDSICFGDRTVPTNDLGRIVVVGFGKACAAMAVGLEKSLEKIPDHIQIEGVVSVPEGQTLPTRSIEVIAGRPAAENLPTLEVVQTSEKILSLVRSTGPNDLCICLISGGGSALLELPIAPISIDEYRAATKWLSQTGTSIYELNAVRRAISQLKGGGLARESKAPIVSLILSDVIGDNLNVIASGPTVVSQEATSPTAIEVLKKFDPNRNQIPESIWSVVESAQGFKEKSIETHVSNHIIGNIETAMKAATHKASELGYNCTLGTPTGNEGSAETVGKNVAAQIQKLIHSSGKHCHIQGGETTVSLGNNPGSGGRNQHLVLSTIKSLIENPIMQNQKNSKFDYCLLSGGTDAEDGTTSAAGAIIDQQFITNMCSKTDEIRSALQRFDSHQFHLANGSLLESKRTWTNVCDLRILLTDLN